MKLYLAAPYAARDVIRALAEAFWDEGHVVTSSWLQGNRAIQPGTLGSSPDSSPEDVQRHAHDDLQDVLRADVLLHFTAGYVIDLSPELDSPSMQLGSGGRHVETGFALGREIPVLVVGEPENIFQRGLCDSVSDVKEALAWLEGYAETH